jgi:hypothetical protein
MARIPKPGMAPWRYQGGRAMKKTSVKKMVLTKETLRGLETSSLEQILGGLDDSGAQTCLNAGC